MKLGLWPRQWRGENWEGSGQTKTFLSLSLFVLCKGNSSTLLGQPACPRRSKHSQYWVPQAHSLGLLPRVSGCPLSEAMMPGAWVLCPLALWPHALHTAPALGKLVTPPPWSSQPLPPSLELLGACSEYTIFCFHLVASVELGLSQVCKSA